MEKLHQFRDFLQRSDIEPLFKSLSVSQTNWGELQTEILQVIRSTGPRHVREALIQASTKLLSTEVRGTSEPASASAAQQSILQGLKRATDVISSLSKREVLSMGRESQKVLIQALSHLADEESMAQFLKIDVLRDKVPIDVQSGKRTNEDELEQLARHLLTRGGLMNHLLLLLFLWQSADSSLDVQYFRVVLGLIAQPNRSLLSLPELEQFGSVIKSQESTKLCEGTPRVHIFCGSPSKINRYDFQGQAAASVLGFNSASTVDQQFVYFEFSVKSKGGSLSNVRVGWGSTKTYFRHPLMNGCDDSHWMMDFGTQQIHYNEATANDDSPSAYDIGNLFGNDDDDNDEPSAISAAAITPTAAAVETANTVEADTVQYLERRDSGKVKWDSGIISCVYSFAESSSLFFINGEYVGRFKTQPIWSENKKDISPIFVGSETSVFDINLGQQPYQYLSQVTTQMDSEHLLSSQSSHHAAAEVVRNAEANFKAYKYLSMGQADEVGFFDVNDVSSESLKTLTLEVSLRLPSNYTGLDQVVVQTSPTPDALVSDGSLTVGISSQLGVFFEIAGCGGKVVTPKESVPCNSWFHVAVAVSYSKSGGKLQVHIYINGQSAAHGELIPEKNPKAFKMPIKHMQVGSPFEKDRDHSFVGDLCNVRVWGNARGGEKITSLMYKSKLSGSESDLLLFFPCDEGIGLEVHDCSNAKPGGKRHNRIYLQGDVVWGSMSSAHFDSALASIQSGWAFPENDGTDVIDLASTLLDRVKIIQEKGADYLAKGWTSAEFSGCGLALSDFLLDFDGQSLELLKCLMVYVLRRAATGVETKMQTSFEKFLPVALSILERSLTFFVRQSPSPLSETLRESLFMVLLFLVNGCSFLSDAISMQLTTSARSILVSSIELFYPEPVERAEVLHSILEAKLKAADLARPLALRRSSSMDGAHNVQVFIKQDFAIALSSLKPEVRDFVLDVFLDNVRKVTTLDALVSADSKPKTLVIGNGAASVKDITKNMKSKPTKCVEHGSFVRRGRDWIYGDEGGSGVGIVLAITKWKEQSHSAAIVLWENNHIGKYRLGYSVTSAEGVSELFDVELLYDDAVAAAEANVGVSANAAVDTTTDPSTTPHVRNPFSGTVFTVANVARNLLSLPDSSLSISKRSTLSFIKDIAEESWLEERRLLDSVNVLVNNFDEMDVFYFFVDFYQRYGPSSSTAAPSRASPGKLTPKELLLSMVQKLAQSVVLDVESNSERMVASVDALSALSGMVFGALSIEQGKSPRDSHVLTKYNVDAFGSTETSSTPWSWTEGIGREATETAKDKAAKKTTTKVAEHVLDNFPIIRVPANIQTRQRGKGLEVSVHDVREWSTLVFDTPMLPNSGIYRWFMKVKFSERRGQILLGFCTEKSSPTVQLGVNDESWGVSPNVDVYHGNQKRNVNLSTSKKISSGSILEFCVDTYEGTFSFTELSSGLVSRFGGKDYDVCRNPKLHQEILFPAISLSNPGDSVLLVGDAGDLKMLQSRMGSSDDRSASTTDDKGTPSTVILGCPTPVAVEVFRTNVDYLTKLWERCLPDIETLTALPVQVGLPVLITLSAMCKWGHVAVEDRTAVSKESLSFLKLGLALLRQLDLQVNDAATAAAREGQPSTSSLREWRSFTLQLVALVVELLGKVIVEAARAPALGSSFNEYLDIGGAVRIESSYAMKSAYSRSLGSDLFVHGWNESPMTLQPTTVVTTWLQTLLGDFSLENCDEAVALFVQIPLFHIGMEGLMHKAVDTVHEEHAGIVTVVVEQVKSFVRQYTALPEAKRSFASERLLLATKCVRSPNQASIVVDGDDSDLALSSILTGLSEEIVAFVFSEYVYAAVIESLLADREYQANTKATAFEQAKTILLLLEDETVQAIKTMFLDQLAAGLNGPYEVFSGILKENTSSTSWHYFDGLNGASVQAGKKLRASFASFMSYLIAELTSLAEIGSERTVLAVLGTLATKVIIFDHESLARSRFFAALEEIINAEPADASPSKDADDLSGQVVTVATKLFIMMALQVASGGKRSVKDRSLPSPSIQRAVSLERMRSGPATLNKTVFDLVQRLLRRAIDRLPTPSSSSSSSPSSRKAPDSLFECVTILLNVAIDEETRKVIATPEWFSLLLELVFAADGKYRHRSFAVLAELLPGMGSIANSDWNRLRSLDGHVGSAFPWDHCSGKQLPLTMILHIIGTFASIPFTLHRECPFLEDGGKLVDQYQSWMAVVTEGVNLYRSLLVSHEAWKTDAMNALVTALGEGDSVGAAGSVPSLVLGALAVFDGYFVCTHQYSMVACPLSGETFIGVITGYMDSSRERVEASGVLVGPDTLHAKYDRKQDMKKMVAAASVLMPIHKTLTSSLPINVRLIQAAMKCFERFERLHTPSTSSVRTNAEPKAETKEEEDGGRLQESKDEEATPAASLPPPSSSLATNEGNDGGGVQAPVVVSAELLEYFRTIFHKFFLAILTHPEFSTLQLWEITATSEFQFFWSKTMDIASTTCRSSDLGVFNYLEEHFHDLAVLLGTKQLQNQSKDAAAGNGGASAASSSGDAKSAAATEPAMTAAASAANPTTPTPASAPRSPNTLGLPSELVESLAIMGFPRASCIAALERTGGDFEEALNILLSEPTDEGYDMAQEEEEEAAHHHVHEPPSSGASASEAKTMEDTPPTNDGDGGGDAEEGDEDEDHGDDEEEEDEDDGGDSNEYHHYRQEPAGRALPFHVAPYFASERIGCLFPGDDIHVIEERVVDGVKWLSFHMADFDNSNYSSTYGDDFFQYLVWAPTVVNGTTVIFDGVFQHDMETEFTDVVFEPASMDRCYRVIGSKGALVRVGIEIGTEEQAMLEPGTVVHAFEESFNAEGTVRIHIDQPVRGWMSKLIGLVERVPDTVMPSVTASSTAPSSLTVAATKARLLTSEYDLQIDDNLDGLSGHDIFTKEDRFFANMQGRRFDFLERADGARLLGGAGRRRKLTLPSATSASISEVQQLLMKTVADVGGLTARKCLLLLVSRWAAEQQPAQAQATSPRLAPVAWTQSPACAETLLKCLRLLLFRGDVNYLDGYQRFLFHGGDFLHVLKQPLSVEDALLVIADKIVTGGVFAIPDEVQVHFREMFLDAIQKNLKQACEARYSDHSWEDTAQEAASDSELLSSPSVNYALWLTLILARSPHDEETLMKLIITWVQTVKAASMSLKCIAYRMSVHLLDVSRALSPASRDVVRLHTQKIVSLRRLSSFAVKRLWQEMEDAPQYSRFMQALTALLFQLTDVFSNKASSLSRAPSVTVTGTAATMTTTPTTTPATGVSSSSQCVRFKRYESHLQFTSQKDLSAPWSLRVRLCRRHFVPEQYEPYVRSEKDGHGGGNGSGKATGHRLGRDHKLQDMIKLLTGEGMDERETTKGRVSPAPGGSTSSSSSAAATAETKTTTTTTTTKATPLSEFYLNPSYLLLSSRAFVKIQKGGRTFVNQVLEDPADVAAAAADGVEVFDEALCVSVGQSSSEERSFNVVIPHDRWVDVVLVCDQAGGVTSLYLDGQLQESMPFTFNLPLTTVGSSKAGYSFAGDISHFQVWNYAKSAMEVSKDFAAMAQGHVTNKPLIHVVYSPDSVDGLFDEMGLVTGMKAHDCTFVDADDTTGGPSLSPLAASANDKASATFLVTADNIDTSDAVELTGYIRVPKSGKKPPLSSGIEDIVVLRYQLLDTTTTTTGGVDAATEEHVAEMHGTLTWSEKQVKMRLQGTYHRVTHVFTLHGHGSDVVSGPPEKISWLRCLTLQGSIRDGVFEGDCFLDLKLDVSPSQPLGTVRLDMASLPAAVEAVANDERVFSIVKVKADSTDGQYVAYFTVQPYRLGEYLSYGLMKGQGSVWIDWQIKASSGNIAFGWTTHSALSHPDASVDANRGTWTYSTSGQASHGDDLYLCDSADEGDIVSLQLNTNTGHLRVFKNYELILVFEHVCDDGMLAVHDHELGEVGKRGIRPFVSVVSPDDCVQLLGAKEGPVDLTFPETDAFARCKLIGRVVRGTIEGVALVSKETNSRWEFGQWTNDCANGVHIEISDIRAETIDVVAVRRYVQDTEDVSVPADELAVGSAVVQRLVEQFYEFRREHAQRGCSLFARADESLDEGNSSSTATQAAVETTETMTSHDETPAVTSDDVAATPQITVSVCAHAPDVVTLTVPLQGTLQAMMEAFAARNSAYAEAFQFKLGDTVLSAEDTAEAAGLTDGCAISAVTRSFTYEDTVDDPVTKYFPSSTAPYIVMIIYEGGATVRDRIEIDDNSRSLRIIRRGEIVEAFQKSMTSDGIGRFKIADGWISERLRGGTEEPVVRILKQRFEVTGPLTTGDLPQYRILRDEGAKLRAEAAFTSDDIGLCPQYTVVSVDEKRMVRNEAESNAWTSRLHVLEPSAHRGWISEKDKLIEKLTDGAFAGVDAAIQMEIARRNKLRASKPSWPLLVGRSTTTNTQSQLLRLKAEVSLSAEVPFLLRKSRHCENVHVSKDFTTVTCPENCSGRQVILGSKGFSHGVHYWEVHVKSANWGTVFIGVAPEDASGWNGMGFINYRATQAFGSETLYGNYYGVNDKIGVLLDMDRGTLTFFKDGEDFNVGRVTVVNMGVAYRHVRKSAGRHSSSPMLYPCFGVKTPGDCLSIKDTHWMSYSGVDSTQTMQRALQALSFVQAWKAAYASSVLQVSHAAVQAMYDDYGHKCSPHFFTTDARPGLPVQLLVSHEALTTAVGEALVQEYGLHVGCNLTTVYGPASLLGVSSWPHGAGWRVWYSCEKNGKRAWYWTVAELREALSAHTVEVLSELLIPISHRQESFNAIDRDSRLSQEAFVQLVTASVLVSPTVSPAATTTEGSSPTVLDTVAPWTYDEDCALVDAVNKVAIRHDHDAASLSAHMVQRYLEQQHLLTDRSATEIHVRYTALCLLNRCLAIVLPLLDLSMADVHRSLLIINTSSSAAGGAQWRPGCSLLAVPSPLRDLVLSMKHIIFTQTKQQVWSLAVKETTVATALPADEYERPDEIREITVNSLKGKHYRSGLPPLVKQFDEQEKMFERWAHQQPTATGTATSSTLLSEWVKEIDERIRVSVFGQLLDAFSTWDDRVLRKAYVHMQDAGQARAFFVKLAGEGVDDQGGPYRAVFQTAIGEDVTHLLPLLVPSDNQAQGVGADRDRFVFNLSLLSHHPRGVSLLQHLGKLVGVAVRHRIQVPLPLASYLFQALCFEVVSVREAMLASQAPLVHSLKALVDMVSDTDGAVFSLEEREEAADFLAEALVKSVKRLQTTSRAVWSTLVTSAIGGGGSSSGSSSSSSSSGSGGSNAAGASLASFAMSLSDVSEHTLRAMVFATLQLPVPATATPTTASTASMAHNDRFASVTEIVDTICAFHLLAQNEALQLFFKGLSQVLPTELCALFTAEELESVISGAQEVDFDVLQQATVYEGVAATDPHIELFWDAVRTLDTEEQALFVNFCSGRSRLPASASDFPMPFKLTAPPATSTEQPDRFLPVARTCFFSLSLPKYSSLDICREKLRYAIRHTEVMDADFVDRRGATAWDALPTAPVTVAAAAAVNDAADGAQDNPTGAETASTSAST